MLAALVLASFLSACNGGELAFPDGRADPGVVLIRVVDRNRVPLRGALVRGVLETCDLASRLVGLDEHAGQVVLEPATTDEDGSVELRAPAGGWCGVTVERSGFAPGSFMPLCAGWSYELVLDFGAVLTLIVEDEQGALRPAELLLTFEHFPALPAGLTLERRVSTGLHGIVDVGFVPAGNVRVQALASDGSRGSVLLSVGSAWRYNEMVFQPPSHVVLQKTHERLVTVTDPDGAAVAGLRARTHAPEKNLGVSAEVELGGVRVCGIPPVSHFDPTDLRDMVEFGTGLRPIGVEVWAPGYRSVRLDCTGDAPPSAVTYRFPVRRLRSPPAPATGSLWTLVDPYGPSHWEGLPVTRDGSPELDVSEDIPLVGALVEEGRVAAWLTSGIGESPEQVSGRWVRPASIGVRVTIDGRPVSCGLIKLTLVAASGAVPPSLTGHMFTYADPEGRCEIGGLFPGRWQVSLSTHLVHSASVSTEVNVFEGEHREIELAGSRGHDVLGRVVDATGAPVGRGNVIVLGLGYDGVVEGAFPVQPDGTFVVTGLVDGFGYVLSWYEAPWTQSIAGSVYRLQDGSEPRTADVQLIDTIPDEVVITIATEAEGPPDRGFGIDQGSDR